MLVVMRWWYGVRFEHVTAVTKGSRNKSVQALLLYSFQRLGEACAILHVATACQSPQRGKRLTPSRGCVAGYAQMASLVVKWSRMLDDEGAPQAPDTVTNDEAYFLRVCPR